MEWLKKILEKAKISEDGKLDVEAVTAAIQKEFSKHAVMKKEYDGKVEELNAANATIVELKEANKGNEELQRKVGEYETEIGKLKKQADDATKTYSLREQLSKQGVLDPDYLIYKVGGLEKFTFDKDGRPVGIEEAVKPYKEDKVMSYLFKQERNGGYVPHNGGGAMANPFAKETFNLTEQGKLLKENPAQAKELAAAAGVSI